MKTFTAMINYDNGNSLTQALEALDGGHIDRAYGYIQEALAQPEQWTPEDMSYRPGGLAQAEFLSTNEADIAQLIEERDVVEGILDNVLDMVLGADRPEWSSSYQYIDAVEDVREALAQPDNTAKMYEELRSIIDGGSESFTHKDAVQYLKDNLAPLKWTPEDMSYRPGGLAQTEQEPVAKVVSSGEYDFPMLQWLSANHSLDTKIGSLLYTSPPQRQPLTDEEIKEIFLRELGDMAVRIPPGWRKVVNAIELHHGIGDKT